VPCLEKVGLDQAYTSTKIIKERSLFNAAQRLNAFVKNVVAFFKLICVPPW